MFERLDVDAIAHALADARDDVVLALDVVVQRRGAHVQFASERRNRESTLAIEQGEAGLGDAVAREHGC